MNPYDLSAVGRLRRREAGMMKTQIINIAVEMRLAEAVAAEREACAKIADYFAKNSGVARNIAAAIRARGDGRQE